MTPDKNASSEELTAADCIRIFRDLVEWKHLRPPEPDDPVVDGMLSILSSSTYGGLIREGFILLKYDPIRTCWHVTITNEGLEEWKRRLVQ
jgi:hypothetical protein